MRRQQRKKHNTLKNDSELRTLLLTNKYIDPVTQCWIWLGSYQGTGTKKRGKICIGYVNGVRVDKQVSRESYRLFNDTYNISADVLHKCNNSMCYNPEHLYLGNKSNNAYDFFLTERPEKDSRHVTTIGQTSRSRYWRRYYAQKNKQQNLCKDTS